MPVESVFNFFLTITSKNIKTVQRKNQSVGVASMHCMFSIYFHGVNKIKDRKSREMNFYYFSILNNQIIIVIYKDCNSIFRIDVDVVQSTEVRNIKQQFLQHK